jgi:hypothetical protein
MVFPTFHDLGHLMVLPSSSGQSILLICRDADTFFECVHKMELLI